MNPAFSVPQLKSFIPLFLRYANKVMPVAAVDPKCLLKFDTMPRSFRNGKTKRSLR